MSAPPTRDANAGSDQTQPLTGLTVLDLGRALAAPHAAQLLGDLGARVIKIEPPGGDESRRWGTPVSDREPTLSSYFMACNRNKESVILDLKTDTGQHAIHELIKHADVLIENFRPGVLANLGLDHDRIYRLNPRLIVLSITGFGHDGPDANRPGYDQIAQGEGGLISLTGSDSGQTYRVGVPIADLLAGLHGVIGILAALVHARHTGAGRTVRTSLLAATVGVHAFQGTAWTLTGRVPQPTANHHPTIAPYGMFHCADAPVLLAVGTDAMWRRFTAEFHVHPRAEKWATNAGRIADRETLTREINERLGALSRDEALTRLDRIGIPAGRVRTVDEVYTWAQTRSQGLLVDVEHPRLGRMQLPGIPLRFDGLPPRTHSCPPSLGAHTERVLAEFTRGECPAPLPAEHEGPATPAPITSSP